MSELPIESDFEPEVDILDESEILAEQGMSLVPDEDVEDVPEAATSIPVDDALKTFFARVDRVPLLSAADEVVLAKRIELGDMAAKNALIEANLRLVISVAKEYLNQGLPFLDLIQEGSISLFRAAEKFDWRQGNKFNTYAVPWIRSCIQKALVDQKRARRIPAHANDKMRSIEMAAGFLERDATLQRESRYPTVEEIADFVDMQPNEVISLRALNEADTSLDKPIGEDSNGDGATLADVVASDLPGTDQEAINNIDSEQLEQQITNGLSLLSELEQQVLIHRYGLFNEEPKTLVSTAVELGWSDRVMDKVRIRRIERQALRKLAGQEVPDEEEKGIYSYLEQIPEREQRVIRLRLGLEGGRSHSVAEIANMLSVVNSRVYQLEKKGYQRMHKMQDAANQKAAV